MWLHTETVQYRLWCLSPIRTWCYGWLTTPLPQPGFYTGTKLHCLVTEMCVNNLPRVVTSQRGSQVLNSWSLNHKSKALLLEYPLVLSWYFVRSSKGFRQCDQTVQCVVHCVGRLLGCFGFCFCFSLGFPEWIKIVQESRCFDDIKIPFCILIAHRRLGHTGFYYIWHSLRDIMAQALNWVGLHVHETVYV